MSTFWRISNHCDLIGLGGEKSDGRWHTSAQGKRIVYLSDSPALALVETLVNLKGNPRFFPDAYQLMRVIVSDARSITGLASGALSTDWRQDLAATRDIGDTWLKQKTSALLEVPSVPSPESINILFNPLHPNAGEVEIEWCKWVEYDKRLFQVRDYDLTK